VSVEVVEPQMADRVRRASDVYLLLGYAVLAAVAITLGNLAVGTADALEQDLALATGGLPRLLLQLFSWVAGVGVLLLPIGVGIDMLLRSRAGSSSRLCWRPGWPPGSPCSSRRPSSTGSSPRCSPP
jgi:hypothetical protein